MPLRYTNPNDWGKSTLTDNALRLQQIKAENPEQWAAMNQEDIQAFFMPTEERNTEFSTNIDGSTFEKLTRVQKLCILKLLCINLINSEASLVGFSLADRESWEIIDLLADINQNLPISEHLSLAEAIINQLKGVNFGLKAKNAEVSPPGIEPEFDEAVGVWRNGEYIPLSDLVVNHPHDDENSDPS